MTVTARATLSERRAEELRLEIARAALQLFVEDGDTSATVDRIAEAAGVAPRTFYRHFEVKEDVVLPLFRRSTQRIAASLREASAGDDPLEVLTQSFARQLDAQRVSPEQRVFIGLMMTNPHYRMRWMQADGDLREAIAELLHLHAELRAEDPVLHLAAELVTHAGRRAFEEWLTVRSDDQIDDLLRTSFTLVLAGLREVAAGR